MAEYLSNEVIASLDDRARWFLLRAAVLGRFTAELCDDVLRTDSASILAELERTNLFVGRSEHGGWYEVHSLFAEFARFRLASEQPGAVPAIHRSAAEWLMARGLTVEAIEHGAAAGDDELVADLLVQDHLRPDPEWSRPHAPPMGRDARPTKPSSRVRSSRSGGRRPRR